MRREIPWAWVVLGFIFVWPVGMVLLMLKLFRNSGTGKWNRGYSRPVYSRTYQPPNRTQSQQYTQPMSGNNAAEWRQNAQTVSAEPVNEPVHFEPAESAQQQRTYQSQAAAGSKSAPQGAGPQNSYNYSYNYGHPRSERQYAAQEARRMRSISPNRGKGLRISGWIVVGTGVFSAAIVFLGMIADGWYYNGFFQATLASSIVALSVCGPGLGLLLPGIHLQNRSERCQTLYAMMQGERRTQKIKEMAAAVPCSYAQAAKDLRWMISEGFFPGAYIDAAKRVITYSGAEPEPEQKKKPKVVKPEEPPKKTGVFPEVERINKINDDIGDEFVSEQIDILAELTHKIFAYVEQNPKREDRISQFKNHYLPKTIKILESYARFEKQGVKGANIRAAMKDVEEIMETLVSGFEKQLDMLFMDEALDVTTDINVLESMMGLRGLSDDDPFKLEVMGKEA